MITEAAKAGARAGSICGAIIFIIGVMIYATSFIVSKLDGTNISFGLPQAILAIAAQANCILAMIMAAIGGVLSVKLARPVGKSMDELTISGAIAGAIVGLAYNLPMLIASIVSSDGQNTYYVRIALMLFVMLMTALFTMLISSLSAAIYAAMKKIDAAGR